MKEATSNVRLLRIAEKMVSVANDGMMILNAIFIMSAMTNPKLEYFVSQRGGKCLSPALLASAKVA